MILYEYLTKRCPDVKDHLINAALLKAKLPRNLRDDGKQQIVLRWLETNVSVRKYSRGQILSYAMAVGYTAALSLRRELGSPVVIPKTCSKSYTLNPYAISAEEYMDDVIEYAIDYHSSSNSGRLSTSSKNDLTRVENNSVPDPEKSVIELVLAGESMESIADIKSRTVRWVRMQFQNISSEIKSHETA